MKGPGNCDCKLTEPDHTKFEGSAVPLTCGVATDSFTFLLIVRKSAKGRSGPSSLFKQHKQRIPYRCALQQATK